MKILRSSFAVVERRAEHAVTFFYSHLFWHHPELRELFPVSVGEMARQRDRIFASLTHVITHLENDSLLPYLQDLGRDHRKFLARPGHYAAIGPSLLAALAAASGTAWTAEAEKAWSQAYQLVADTMTAAAGDGADPPWWDAEVVRHLRYGQDTGVLTLRPHTPFPYLPGQYASVSSTRVPRTWRTYSLANAPRPDGTLDVHVSRIPGGRLSTALVREVRPGERLRLGAAGGRFTLRRADRPVTFICAGTGWAPVKALLEELAVHPPDQDLRLFVVARDTAHLYDRPFIDAYATALGKIAVTYLTPAPGRHRDEATDRLVTALGHRARWPDQDVYLSGPAPFVAESVHRLEALGALPGRIFHDAVPAHGDGGRPLGFAEWFLDRPAPHWHNPAARTPLDP
ncbi:globin domain-containing protein [Streptomyces sp. NPDC051567]|uniref:globin domain-containing protein n=1 Tax=Streptomyces sp. NPDC051567 TaxID=3365660 RepID=UPI0037AE710B